MKLKSLIDDKKRARAMEAMRKGDLDMLLRKGNTGATAPESEELKKRALSFHEQRELNHQLVEAALQGDFESVRKLVARGVIDLNYPDDERALICAAKIGHAEMAGYLISSGADVNVPDTHRQTALLTACWNGHKEVVEILLANGARVDFHYKHGWTALAAAEQHGHMEIGELLRKHGAVE